MVWGGMKQHGVAFLGNERRTKFAPPKPRALHTIQSIPWRFARAAAAAAAGLGAIKRPNQKTDTAAARKTRERLVTGACATGVYLVLFDFIFNTNYRVRTVKRRRARL